jgi:uncharacterized protein (DUF1800 family)
VHQWTGSSGYCDSQPSTCWRDNYSSIPLVWDFYRNAIAQPDQLRQRVAFALQQILVVSGLQISGTYGFRNYQNALLANAFGNYGDVLKSVMLSPVMGDYLNGVNNDKAAPNENFARELLQLFSLGNCQLNGDGSLVSGKCLPVYDNDMVRNYAYALTGWTYPAGGATAWGCGASGLNCQYYGGNMVPVEALHDKTQRTLLGGVNLPANQGAAASMGYVLSSLMAHSNMAPFIGRQLIQHLVTSNPSAGYVQRVSNAFNSGRYTSGSASFGTGVKGDLTATVAAILLDAEARGEIANANSGKLREPVLLFTGVLRQYAGATDGDALGWWWGDMMRQHVFRPPSVFNFYPPDFPVAGTGLMGPAFALHGASSALNRLNYLTYLIDWGGSAADSSVPNAIGTRINLSGFTGDASDAGKLVDRLSLLATGKTLAESVRGKIVAAVEATSKTDALARTKTAAYLVLATPDYQVSP